MNTSFPPVFEIENISWSWQRWNEWRKNSNRLDTVVARRNTRRGSWAKSYSWAELDNVLKVGRQKQKLMRLTNQQFCVQHKKLSFNWEQLSLSNKQQVGLAMVLQVTQLFLKSLLVYKANKSIQNSRSSFHLCQLQLKTCKISIFIGSTLIRALLIGNIISKVAISYNTHSKPSNWSAGQWFVLLQARFEKRVQVLEPCVEIALLGKLFL